MLRNIYANVWRPIAIDAFIAAAVIGAWYWLFAFLNRRRSKVILRWLESAFCHYGEIGGVSWLTGSRFQVRLRLATSCFRHPNLVVQLTPREFPIRWVLSRWRKRQETVTFESDLDYAPSFNLNVQNYRWVGRTRRRIPRTRESWQMEQVGPFVISTRRDWERDITNMMDSLLASRACDLLNVTFRRRTPNLSATVPLQSLAPEIQAQSEANIFDVLRELASGAQASRF